MEVSKAKTPPVQPAQPPKKAAAVQQAQNQEIKSKPPEPKKTPEARPAPVVNTQGQTIGKHLNVTA